MFLDSANKGNPESSRYLGLMYLSGNGVTKNLKTSIQWFEKAAVMGDKMSKDNLQKIKEVVRRLIDDFVTSYSNPFVLGPRKKR